MSDDKDVEVLEAEGSQGDFVPEVQPVVVVRDEIKLDSTEVRKRIVEIKDEIGTHYTELCRLIRHVQLKQLYTVWGYTTFKEYVTKELEFKATKALYLAQIWKNLHENQDAEVFQKVIVLGWSKAKELARVVTKENVDEWVEKATHLGVDSLIKEVKAELSKKIPDDPKDALSKEGEVEGTPVAEQTKTSSFTFAYQDYLTLQSALDIVNASNPGIPKGAAISLICADFLAGNPEHQDAQAFGLTTIQKLAAIHGWNVVVQKAETKELLHGMEELKVMIRDAFKPESPEIEAAEELLGV